MKIRWKHNGIFKSNLSEYFYYFVLVSFLVTIMLGGFFYFYFSAVLRNETIQANSNVLVQLKNAQEAILSEVDRSLNSIVLDPFFISYTDYYQSSKKDYLLLQSIQNKLKNIVTLNEYIDSVYVYYYQDDLVLSSIMGCVALDNFYDREFLQRILRQAVRGSFEITREMVEHYSQQKIEVFSLIKPIPIYFSGKPKAIMVINIKGAFLQQTIDSIKVKEDSNVIIADTGGNIISQKNGGSFINETDLQNYLQKTDRTATGSNIKGANGKTVLISSAYSDKYKWRYIYIVPMTTVTSSIRFIGKITIIFCLIVVLLSIIGAFFLSKRIYSPIKALLNMFNRLNTAPDGEDATGPEKEIVTITHNISKLIDLNKNLEETLKDYEIYRKNRFLLSLIDGNFDDNKVLERLSYYNVDLDVNGVFLAFVISMDKYSKFFDSYSERQQNMLFININESINNLIFKNYQGFIVEAHQNEIVIVINFSSGVNKAEIKFAGLRLAQQIHSLISEDMTETFTVGVSLIHQGLRSINECYREGTSAVAYKILLGYNQVIYYENMETKRESIVFYPFAIEKEIINNLKVGDRDGVITSVDDFVDYICVNITDNIELVRHYFLQLLSVSVKCLYEIDRNHDLDLSNQKDIYTSLLKEGTIQGMASYMNKFYDSVLELSHERRSIKNQELVATIIKYIEAHLDSDLSLEKLAEQFYISPSHLRKIFKDGTDTTVKEFINNLRMAKAKEMLENPHIKMADIATKAGYLSVQAFTRAFKFYTGITPGEFRTECAFRAKSDESC